MLARRKAVLVLIARSFTFLVIASFGCFLFAQTGLDDVHVLPKLKIDTSPSSQRSENSLVPLIKSESELVLVPVSVTDTMERFVTGLSESNFEVFEDKKQQKIQNFSKEDLPVSVGIILDVSGSMADKVERLREAVNQFCEAANPQDEFFMIVFADEPRLLTDFTTSSQEVEKELLFTRPKGRTSLLDAIHMGLRKMQSARYAKKALLILSDGGDNHSRYGESEVKALARESDVMIYSIGIFDRYVPTMEEMLGPSLLSEIAEPTGGRSYTVDNPNEMPAVARRIGLELRTQYMIAYRPQNIVQNGRWRKIRVKLSLPKKFPFLRARSRPGYYASIR